MNCLVLIGVNVIDWIEAIAQSKMISANSLTDELFLILFELVSSLAIDTTKPFFNEFKQFNLFISN